MARWLWATDNYGVLNLDLLTRLEIYDNGNGTYDVRTYGSSEVARTVLRNAASLTAARTAIENIIGGSVVTAEPVTTVLDVDP